jgi:phosphoglycolate phosphatase
VYKTASDFEPKTQQDGLLHPANVVFKPQEYKDTPLESSPMYNASSTSLFPLLDGIERVCRFRLTAATATTRKSPTPKPSRSSASSKTLVQNQVAMGGDTITDMLFAKRAKAGYTIALLSGSNDKKSLRRLSDVVYPDISALLTDKRLFPAL